MEDLIPIVAIIAMFSIPIVAIFTSHQRKMGEMITGRRDPNLDAQIMHELQSLRAEVTRLNGKVNDITLAVDDHRSLQSRTQDVGH